MSNQIQTIANASTATTVTTGTATAVADWLTTNQAVIGLSIAFVSLVIGLSFHIIGARISKINGEKANRIALMNQIGLLRSEGKTEEEIKKIMKLAGVDYAS